MSRRWSSRQPYAPPSDDDLALLTYGERTYHERAMPGCTAYCCWQGPWTESAIPSLLLARLEWQTSGADLVPTLNALLALVAVGSVILRALGGGW